MSHWSDGIIKYEGKHPEIYEDCGDHYIFRTQTVLGLKHWKLDEPFYMEQCFKKEWFLKFSPDSKNIAQGMPWIAIYLNAKEYNDVEV